MLRMQPIIRPAVLFRCFASCKSVLANRYEQFPPSSTDDCISPLIMQEYHTRVLIFDSGTGQDYAFFSDVDRR